MNPVDFEFPITTGGSADSPQPLQQTMDPFPDNEADTKAAVLTQSERARDGAKEDIVSV